MRLSLLEMKLKLIHSKQSPNYALGRICSLEVLRLVSIGAYLEWSNEDGVLLPKKYLPDGVQVGDKLNVFIYHDNEGRLIATTLQPYAQVGEVALLDCVSVTAAGAFLDWGIHKDVFVPFSEQNDRMQEGHSYIVYLYVDHVSEKIVASAKLGKHIGNKLPDYVPGTEVQAIITGHNDVGFRAIVDHSYWGILYFDSLDAHELNRGLSVKAYVIRTREDGRLDLSLNPIGYNKLLGDAEKLLDLLKKNTNKLTVGDKSDAGEIYKQTGLSKKSFKSAIGRLYKERKVRLTPYSVELL